MTDPIPAVQAMVGCPHVRERRYEYEVGGHQGSRFTHRQCTRCRKRIKAHDELPSPAPDCSTTDGALDAADKLLPETYWIEVHSDGPIYLKIGRAHALPMVQPTSINRPTAICTLILEAVGK